MSVSPGDVHELPGGSCLPAWLRCCYTGKEGCCDIFDLAGNAANWKASSEASKDAHGSVYKTEFFGDAVALTDPVSCCRGLEHKDVEILQASKEC